MTVHLDSKATRLPASPGIDWRHWGIIGGMTLVGIVMRYLIFLGLASDGDLAQNLCRWDCKWFGLAAEGYETALPANRLGEADWAFFPLYPQLVRLFGAATGLSFAWSGVLLSQLFGVLAAVLSRPLFVDRRAYDLFAFSLLLGPFSLLFWLPYSESLYILLTLLGLGALRRANFPLAGAIGALLSATRVTGILFGVAILVEAVADHFRRGGKAGRLLSTLLAPRVLLALLLVPLGLIAFAVHLRLAMGDGLAFAHVQIAWYRELGNPFANWFATVVGNSSPRIHALAVLFGLGLVVVLFRRRRQAEAAFCLAAVALSTATGMESSLRFFAGLAPFGLVTCELLAERRRLYWLAYPVGLLLGAYLFHGWLTGSRAMV